ncbi:hypothetical protein NMY22_g8868 [Coprinellus aureogranulatus]|nr:hypothetical protein NMY22_g8868 [Coprinellus aureogranulatus]
MATVTIPPRAGREFPGMPPRSSRIGASRIQGVTHRTLTSLPQQEVQLRLDATPSSSHLYPVSNDIRHVVALRGISVPQLPESLLSLEWVIGQQAKGVGALRFDEDGLARACSLPHEYLQSMIREQLETYSETSEGEIEGTELTLHASLQLEINREGNHKCDIGLTNESIPYAFLEFKTSLSAGASCWNDPIFKASPTTYITTMDRLLGSVRNMISQCVFYAKLILNTLGRPTGSLLVALVLPPTRFHYILVDLGSATVAVTENAIDLEDMNPEAPDYVSKTIQHLINPDSWTAYWKQALWFHLLTLYFNYPEVIHDAVAADALREANQRRLPDGILQRLEHDCQVLCNIPSAHSWTSLLVRNAEMAASWVRRFGNRIRKLWVSLAWAVLGTEGVLLRANRLQIPDEVTLIVSDLSESRTWTIDFPQGVISRSHGGKKRVHIYRNLGVVIKVFEPALVSEFEAEVNAYDCLSDLQGKVVPTLYASGKMEGGSGSFLVCSYEGEPRKQWSEEDRAKIQGLVTHIHSYGVHHHDIAPRNVVVDSTGKYSLIDFGLSSVGCNESRCSEVAEWASAEDEALPYSM